jgi:hypothetical protein
MKLKKLKQGQKLEALRKKVLLAQSQLDAGQIADYDLKELKAELDKENGVKEQ